MIKVDDLEREQIQNESHVYMNIILLMLKNFAKSNRFELNRMFLKEDEISACKNVLKCIEGTKLMKETDFSRLVSILIASAKP